MTRNFSASYDRRNAIQDSSPEVNSKVLTMSAADIERLAAKKLRITPGSCEISPTSPGRPTNMTLFRVRDENGKTALGRIEVRIIAGETSIKVIPDVRILGWVRWHRRWSPGERRDQFGDGL